MTVLTTVPKRLAPLGNPFRERVRQTLRQRAADRGLDGILMLSPANVFYACGFHFSVNERPIGLYVRVDGEATLFVPLLELENAEPVEGVKLGVYEEFPGLVHPVVWMVCQSKAARIAIDVLDARQIAPLNTLVEQLVLEDLVAPSRFVKTAEELDLTRVAASYADMVLERLLSEGGNIIAQGGTELDLTADSTDFARAALKRDYGLAFAGTKLGVSASVHSGLRAALPHGSTSNRQPQFGETLISGIGCSLGGYHAESGVTLIVGEMKPSSAASCRRCNNAMTPPSMRSSRARAVRMSTTPRSTRSRPPISATPSATASAMAWAWKATRRPGLPPAI
ncbi:MAG: Peptidase [Devosia sp.]|nr:Peptidase [Devosia sp.]